MIIRPVAKEDIDAIEFIEKSSMSMPWSKDSFVEALESDHTVFLVAEDDGKIAGFVVLYLSVPEADLPDIVVDEKYRGRGVGRKLMESAIDAVSALGVTDIFLEVRKSNFAAKSLYEKLGFVELGIRKNFYESPVEDAICMKKGPF